MQDPAIVVSLVDETEAAAEANLLDQAEQALAAARLLGSTRVGPAAPRSRRRRPCWSDEVGCKRPNRASRSILGSDPIPAPAGTNAARAGICPETACAGERPHARRSRTRSRHSAPRRAALGRARTEELGRIGGRHRGPGVGPETERLLADLVAEGRTNKEVASALALVAETVESDADEDLPQARRPLANRARQAPALTQVRGSPRLIGPPGARTVDTSDGDVHGRTLRPGSRVRGLRRRRAARVGRRGGDDGAGTPVLYLGSVYVPDEECSFCCFEAEDAEAVGEANRRAGVSYSRLVEAVFVER